MRKKSILPNRKKDQKLALKLNTCMESIDCMRARSPLTNASTKVKFIQKIYRSKMNCFCFSVARHILPYGSMLFCVCSATTKKFSHSSPMSLPHDDRKNAELLFMDRICSIISIFFFCSFCLQFFEVVLSLFSVCIVVVTHRVQNSVRHRD